MGLNSDIAEVTTQIDKIMADKADRWLNISDYNLKIKDRKNMKSAYGLIYNILHHGDKGSRIIDRIPMKSQEYLYKQCVAHVNNLG